MHCRLCGSESGGASCNAGGECRFPYIAAPDPFGLACELCGVALPAGQRSTLFLEKFKQLAQFGLTSNVRLLSEPSGAEN
jgi:hypothetical protein